MKGFKPFFKYSDSDEINFFLIFLSVANNYDLNKK